MGAPTATLRIPEAPAHVRPSSQRIATETPGIDSFARTRSSVRCRRDAISEAPGLGDAVGDDDGAVDGEPDGAGPPDEVADGAGEPGATLPPGTWDPGAFDPDGTTAVTLPGGVEVADPVASGPHTCTASTRSTIATTANAPPRSTRLRPGRSFGIMGETIR
jgi:hypothetical protein